MVSRRKKREKKRKKYFWQANFKLRLQLATDHLPFGGLNDTQVVGSIGTDGSPSSQVQILVFIISGSILKRKRK